MAYVSDYISKPALKTYLIFEAVKSVFDRNSEMLEESLDRKEKARRLLTQIVNNLTSKMEIGGPMASMYLLKKSRPLHKSQILNFLLAKFYKGC